MNITIIADASFCPETKIGGYAFWIACQRGKRGGRGVFKDFCNDNTVAEMRAVANGLHEGLKANLIQEGDKILLQTDCLGAIMAFEKTRHSLSKQELQIVTYIEKLAFDFSLKLRYKHVKGHSNNLGARFVSNNTCDAQAKSAMRQARNQFKINQIKELLK